MNQPQYIGGVAIHKNKFSFCLYKDEELVYYTDNKKDWELISKLMESMEIKVYTENELVDIIKEMLTPELKKKIEDRYKELLANGITLDSYESILQSPSPSASDSPQPGAQ